MSTQLNDPITFCAKKNLQNIKLMKTITQFDKYIISFSRIKFLSFLQDKS